MARHQVDICKSTQTPIIIYNNMNNPIINNNNGKKRKFDSRNGSTPLPVAF
jgi:hypothetical protein